jgi:4-hydroxy-tetrahydrodipicolinate synthase
MLGADLAPDADATLAHCRWLLANGCNGIGLLGTTGEAPSFAKDARRALVENIIEGGIPGERLILGTGAAALADAVELTRHGTDAGVAGCLVVPPFYFKNVADDGLYAYYAELIERVGHDGLRLYLYHFPQMSAVPIPHGVIARLMEGFPGIIAGAKDSSGDFDNMQNLIRNFPDLEVFSGTERYLLAILEAGGTGCISAGANVISGAIGALYSHWCTEGADDKAARLQDRVTGLRDLLEGVPMIPAMKAILARHRNEPGLALVAPPLIAPGDEECAQFLARMDGAGLELP